MCAIVRDHLRDCIWPSASLCAARCVIVCGHVSLFFYFTRYLQNTLCPSMAQRDNTISSGRHAHQNQPRHLVKTRNANRAYRQKINLMTYCALLRDNPDGLPLMATLNLPSESAASWNCAPVTMCGSTRSPLLTSTPVGTSHVRRFGTSLGQAA